MSAAFLKRSIIFLFFILIIGTPFFYGGLPQIFNFHYISQQVYPYSLSKEVFFQAIVELIFGLWLALIIIDKKYRPKLTPAMRFLITFLFVLTLAAVFGVDPQRSFWSTYERVIGVVAVYHLAALALVLSSLWKEIPWQKIFLVSLWTSFLVSALAWIQMGLPNLLLIENKSPGANAFNPNFRPGSTFGNPTFLDAYLIFNVFIAVYLLLEKYSDKNVGKQIKKHFSLSGLFLFLSLTSNIFTIFLSQTRGDILAIGFGFLVLLFLFALNPPEINLKFLRSRKFYTIILLIIVVFGSGFWFTRKASVWDKVPGLSRFKDVNLSLNSSDFLPRLSAARAAWKGFLDRPIIGWGPENFNIVFNKYYEPQVLELNYEETRFDKPHNFILEYLATGGALLTVAYFAFLAAAFWEARKGNRLWGNIMIAGLVAYIVANAFVFETIGGLLMLYLVFGYSDGLYREKKEGKPSVNGGAILEKDFKNRKKEELDYWIFVPIVTAVVFAYIVNFQTYLGSYYEYWAFQYMGVGRFGEGISYFKKAISTWSPYDWNFKRDYAAATAEAYFYNPGAVSVQDAEDAVHAFEEARDAHPLDAYNHYALVDLYNQISAIDPQKYTALAEQEAKIALQLSPNRQEIYISLAKTKLLEKDGQAALTLLKRAVELDPKVADPHFYYGLVAYSLGDSQTGYTEVEESFKLNRQFKDTNEALTTANFFADSGHLQEAIGLYKQAINLDSNNYEAIIKLGVAYYFAGQRDLAYKDISEVAAKYNLLKSPSFGQIKPILDVLGIKY